MLITATACLALALTGCSSTSPPDPDPAKVPAKFLPDIEKAAMNCPGLPPEILAAQLWKESTWDAHAESDTGAKGLAQFEPGTWKLWGRDTDHNGTSSPFDPADAIDAQGRFMCSLLKQARSSGYPVDDVELALAGYNAGWGSVQQYRGIPPYPETITYVSRILKQAAKYRAGFDLPSSSPTSKQAIE